MKIGMKLGTAFAFLGFVILVIIYLGLNTASNMNKEIKDLAYDKFKKTVWANDIINQLNIVSRAVRNAIITENIQTRNDEIKRLEPAAKIVSQRMDSLNANIQDEKGKLLLNELAIIRKDYFGAREKLLKLIDSKNKKEIEDYLFGDFRKAQNAYIDKITEIINYQGDLFNETAQNAEKSYNAQFTLMSIIGALSILIAILMAIFVTRGITKPIGKAVEAAENIARGNMNVDLETNTKDETGMLINAMKTMSQNIGKLLKEMNRVANAAVEGKLDTRGNSGEFAGEYQNIVLGFNATLDAVIGPLNVTAEYVDRISKGDIPPKITDEYKGDFNEIKNNLNTCIDAVNLLVSDAHSLARAAVEGRLDTRADASKHQGDFRKIVQGVNDTLDAVIGPLNVAAEYVDRISKGDIPPKITDEYKGDFNEIKNNLNTCIDAINLLVQDSLMLVKAAEEGELKTRAEAIRHQGDFRKIIEGVNKTLDNVINPMNVAADFLHRVSNGMELIKITDNYKGDFNVIKNNINTCIDILYSILGDTSMLAKGAVEGRLDIRADLSKYKNAWYELVKGINDTLDAVTGPLNVAAEYVDRISKGDIPPKITDEYKGDFNEIKNNLNTCIDAINLLISDVHLLALAAVDGRLDTRADALKHQGDFRKIVQGVNDTLNAVIEPIKEANQVLGIMATGDLTARMLGDYRGDLAKLKQDINMLADSLSGLIRQVNELVDNTASSATEISATAEGLAAASQEQSAQADEVASAVEQMSRTITENAMAANKTAEVAQENGRIASEGGQVVSQTVDKMRDIAKVVKNSAENIEKLGESSKQIGEIISVIDDIADQTNLLALNAAIEAARAGEQGRGFAVVADEVRKLAERTTEATKQIAVMIKGIQSETEAAVIAMNKGTTEVTSGIELADKAGQSLKQILNSTQEVIDMINRIAAASEEQSATSEQISKNVTSISQVTAESAKRVEDVAHTAEDLAKMTNQLADLMRQFKIDEYSSNMPMRQLSRNRAKQLESKLG
ncbi:MAG: methyl-accepting chemotaxis protein [Ignavibacteria bacterium]|nr:methyl-accepting chemotaxis protein [Ignavibacteria bacterium]